MRGRGWSAALALALAAGPAWAQPRRPSESELFGSQPAPERKPQEPGAERPKDPPGPPADEPRPSGESQPAPPRPSETDIFGTPTEPKKPATGPDSDPLGPGGALNKPPARQTATDSDESAPRGDGAALRAPGTPESARDDAILGVSERSGLAGEAAPEDPLKIGGMFYLRAQTMARDDESPDDWTVGAPALVDAYLDARPNERVRGLIVGRLMFDPTLPTDGDAASSAMQVMAAESGATMGIGELSSLFGERTRGPSVALDQMWLRFDVKHRVFFTAGKQHARWGTARFWTPTDFLHMRRRNPLDVFDARTGTTMLKMHVPWEALGWNFYGYGLLEDRDATPRLGTLAGAARAEIVLGTTEVGLGALLRPGRKPKFGFDASTGVWDIDLYGELALRYGSEIDRVTVATDPGPPDLTQGLPAIVEALYPVERQGGVKPQVVGGATYARKYNDNDVFLLGVEYFYNQLGYDNSAVYPGLLLPHPTPLAEPATFFYLGRHYGAAFLSIPAPYSWDQTTFSLSTLGNFSDRSYVTRLDYSLVLLTHLRFEAFVAVHYGELEGEFRFGIRNLEIAGRPFSTPGTLLDLGLGLRVNL
jgi:hypothetical protein